MLRNCDCGACCEACGHDDGCIRYDVEPTPSADAVVANPPAGSFLAWMLQQDGGAA